MKARWLILLLIAAFTVFFTRCSQQEKQEEESELVWLNHHDSVKYVGMAACRECHSDKFETFIHTGMGESFGDAKPEKSAARFHLRHPVYDAGTDLNYLPFWKDDDLYFLEYRLSPTGDTLHSRLERIDYIVGSGQHTNSHIININGFLYQAPLTWYAQKGKWDLPPGYENGQNSRFSRLIGDECMSCHNGLPGFESGSENKFTFVPKGIDCERCHGPGELHVQQKKKGILVDVTKGADYTIVNPARLSWELQVDVCQRCHLQGNAILEEGKDFHDFRPGMPLRSVMTIFMSKYEGREDEFIMASHAQRFQQSPCFIQSNKKGSAMQFTCISCHDPHVSVKVTGTNVFNASCDKCHKKEACTEDPAVLRKTEYNCVQCHMPSNTTLDIPHVTVHDHYIRKPLAPGTKVDEKRFAGLYAVNNDNPSQLLRIKAYLAQYEKFERGNKVLLDSAENILLMGGKAHLQEWIRLAFLKEDYAAVEAMSAEYTGNDGWTLYRIGRSFHQLNKNKEAEVRLKAAVTQMPYQLDFQNEYAVVLIENGRYPEAMALLNQLLTWQPRQVNSLSNRGYLHEKTGKKDLALKDYEAALKLDADYLPALFNLCRYYLEKRDKTRVLYYLGRAKKIAPNHPSVKIISENLKNT